MRPGTTPPALSSGALADQVRERLDFRLYGIPLPDPSDALAALAQLVARLEQAERKTNDAWEFEREMLKRAMRAESALAACEAERAQWKAVASEVGRGRMADRMHAEKSLPSGDEV